MNEQLKLLQREMAVTKGGEEKTDRALDTESDVTGRFPSVFVVDEHPIGGLLLGENNHFQFTDVDCLSPSGKWRWQGHINNSDVTLLNHEIGSLSIRCT